MLKSTSSTAVWPSNRLAIDEHRAQQTTEVGFVDAQLVLDRVAGQTDLVTDDRIPVVNPVIDEAGLDVVGVLDGEVVTRREAADRVTSLERLV